MRRRPYPSIPVDPGVGVPPRPQPTGERVHVATGTEIRTYDLRTRALLSVVQADGAGALAFDPTANQLVVGFDDGRVATLDATTLGSAGTGTSQARIESAFPITDAQLADIRATMEKRFGKKLEASVVVVPELIGGVRVIVGDEVLDTSIRARLDQMKAALLAA